MIEATCITSLFDAREILWPNKFQVLPQVGDYVEGYRTERTIDQKEKLKGLPVGERARLFLTPPYEQERVALRVMSVTHHRLPPDANPNSPAPITIKLDK